MTSEQKVKSLHPKADCLFSQAYRYWGVFLEGRPHVVSCGPSGTMISAPFADGNTKSNAWVNARKKLEIKTP